MREPIPCPLQVDDTAACPVASSRAGCGARHALAVATVGTPLGVFCLTLCPACAVSGQVPDQTAARAAVSVLEHCEHLDCDLDTMASALAGERG